MNPCIHSVFCALARMHNYKRQQILAKASGQKVLDEVTVLKCVWWEYKGRCADENHYKKSQFCVKEFKDVTLSKKKSFNNVFFDLLGISRVYVISVVILAGNLHIVIVCFYFSPERKIRTYHFKYNRFTLFAHIMWTFIKKNPSNSGSLK